MIGLLTVASMAYALSIPAAAASVPPGLNAALDPTLLAFPVASPVRLKATTGGEGSGQDFMWLQPGQTRTILMVKGPALIHRIWSTSGFTHDTEVYIKVDGKQQLLWGRGDLPPSQRPTGGERDPLRAMDGQAYWSYVPIPVRRSAGFIARDLRKPKPPSPAPIRMQAPPAVPGPVVGNRGPVGPGPQTGPLSATIQPRVRQPTPMMAGGPITAQPGPEVEGNKLYLQVAYTPGPAVVPDGLVEQARKRLKKLQADPLWGLSQEGEGGKLGEVRAEIREVRLSRGAFIRLPADELAVIVGMLLEVGETPIEQLKATRLIIRNDGARDASVDVPLPYLVGAYWKLEDYNGAFTAVRTQQLVFRLPIPIGNGLEIGLGQFGRAAAVTSVKATLIVRKLSQAPPYRLCAEYREVISRSGEPIHIADIKGEGTFVGCTFAGDGLEHLKFSFLEGNEQIYVDGAEKPQWEGTGTEDFFNSAWYFSPGTACRAFHGLPHLDPGPPPRMSSYRYLIADRIGFKQGLKFDMQHGSRNGCPDILYKTVAFWYQKPPCRVLEPAVAKLPEDTSITDTTLLDEGPPEPDVFTPSALAILVVLGAAWLYKRHLRAKH